MIKIIRGYSIITIDITDGIDNTVPRWVVAIEILQINSQSGQLEFIGGFKPFSRSTMVRDVSFGKWKKEPICLSLLAREKAL
jgi:hypothetical protein